MRNLFTYLLCFMGFFAISQNKQILYGFDDIPQSLLLNPGSKVDQNKHFAIPFLSHIHLSGGSSGVTVYDIFKEGNDDINARILDKIHDMKSSDFFTATMQLELISFGWRARNEIYYYGGIYEEVDFISYFPKDLAVLAWEGNRDYLDHPFHFDEISATGDITTVYHFGLNKQLSKRLTVGARFKLYSSAFSFRSVGNTGTFTTELSDDSSENIYRHIIENGDISIKTAGYTKLRDLEGTSLTNEMLGRSLFGGNLGIGMDIGFTYDLNRAWSLSASVLDIGAIFNYKDVETYHAYGSYTFDGVNLLFPALNEGDSTYPYYDDLEDEIGDRIFMDTLQTTYSQFRPLKINVGLGYGFGRYYGSDECNCLKMDGRKLYKHNVGVQFYSIFRPKGPKAAGTLFYFRRFTDYLSAKATYTIDPYSYSNVGLGVSTNLGKMNLYLAADNLLSYTNLTNANNLSLQIGLNIIIDEK